MKVSKQEFNEIIESKKTEEKMHIDLLENIISYQIGLLTVVFRKTRIIT